MLICFLAPDVSPTLTPFQTITTLTLVFASALSVCSSGQVPLLASTCLFLQLAYVSSGLSHTLACCPEVPLPASPSLSLSDVSSGLSQTISCYLSTSLPASFSSLLMCLTASPILFHAIYQFQYLPLCLSLNCLVAFPILLHTIYKQLYLPLLAVC